VKSPPGQGVIHLIGPLPPPVNGLSIANAAVADALARAGWLVRRHSLSAAQAPGRLRYHLSRAGAVVRALAALVREKPAVACLSVDGGLGLAYGVIVATVLRLTGAAVSIHHHSFAYIDRPSRLMRLFLKVAPRRRLHVFLCAEMAGRFAAAYPEPSGPEAAGVVLPNAFMVPVTGCGAGGHGACAGVDDEAAIVLGHLSNLSPEKGCDLFLDLFERLADAGAPVRAVLAGPVTDPGLVSRIALMRLTRGGRFDYRGAVYGDDKAKFFEAIDVFAFPSRYRNEAQPLVLIEALANGRPLMTVARGCIDCDHAGHESLVARSDASFVDEAAAWLEAVIATPGRLADLAASARYRAAGEAAAAHGALNAWMNALSQLATAAEPRP
jgi:glycosyltransferase involved in cell wall biosynthesis